RGDCAVTVAFTLHPFHHMDPNILLLKCLTPEVAKLTLPGANAALPGREAPWIPHLLNYANAYPLTKITKTTEVPLRKPIALEIDTPKCNAPLRKEDVRS
nr:hypothetical protein [Tanacetum cinerariifolium]